MLRTAVAPELRDWADNRLISAHIRIVKPMVAGTVLNAVVVCAALIGRIPWLDIAMFVGFTFGAAWHRVWLADGIARGRRQKRPQKIALAFRLNSLWMGLTFGILLALWFPGMPADVQLLLAVCATTQIASAAYTVRTLPKSATIYVACQAIGLAIGLARIGTATALCAIVVLMLASALLVRMAFTARDLFVTRILSDRDLAASARTVKLLLNEYEESGSDMLFELDRDHRLAGVSRRLSSALGLSTGELEGRTLTDLLAPSDERDSLARAIAERKRVSNLIVSCEGADGHTLWWSVTGRPCFPVDGERTTFRGVITDVTSQRIAESRAQRMASFDTLTGLPNRVSFDRVLEQVLDGREASDRVALLLVDIDHFKHVNDVHGHPVGDALLRIQAEAMAGCVEDSGLGGTTPIVARLASDEFAILVTGHDACDHAIRLSELLIDVLAQPVVIDGRDLAVSVSVGIALAPFHTDQKDQLQSYAGISLQAAKQGGRSMWEMFEPGMDAVLHERHALALDLRHAVARGELRLFIQPLVDVASEAKTGYEALLRWQHPTRGLVAPDQFIPIAEETGLIVPIGEWVIRSAFAEAATWEGGETIAINLSAVQVGHANLLPVIVNALAETGLDPARVEFEITESVLLDNSETNIEVLNRLHTLGVKIALDDFGTGYASLTYLLTFPFDKIKIDRRFISDLATREESQAIVGAVIALANQLGMCTLAEGVEEQDQLDTLRRHGCRMVQGWLFGKALPSEEYHPRREIALAPPPAARLPRARKTRASQTYSRRARA
ncbi:PAS domain S-box-containing protein/diguanylate cyclase (GGDEF)-like protein [Novosphingobium kunmingense]|uniref:PAS domain S-box-containing protein/diguanylate cyclase (GGDEF)-like protein n=1 Tax=Novosphingobium kunmingense TaxID=1211806 RepID=A0A2N0H6Y8_9SPHN|nr:PAS domain S-box-containing protein/diguanylate cyclase (GGDEF)-like protein [Novosphingobium kunmingense]